MNFIPEAQQPLSSEFCPKRFDTRRTSDDLGWVRVHTQTTTDRNKNEVTEKAVSFDPLPETGVRLDTLEMSVEFMGLDETVGRLIHCEEMAVALKARKGFLKRHLGEIAHGKELVQGEVYEAGYDQEPVLRYGLRKDVDHNREQGRLRDEADNG